MFPARLRRGHAFGVDDDEGSLLAKTGLGDAPRDAPKRVPGLTFPIGSWKLRTLHAPESTTKMLGSLLVSARQRWFLPTGKWFGAAAPTQVGVLALGQMGTAEGESPPGLPL